MITTRTRRRAGFTIVELLVAMALIILIMAVLSEAFVAGLSAFTSLKAIGDMQERMRVSASRLRQDLSGYHFEESRRLSDFDAYFVDPAIGNGNQGSAAAGVPPAVGGRPQQGFLRIQTPPTSRNPAWVPPSSMLLEGADPDNIPSWITDLATVAPQGIGNPPIPGLATGPILHFTTKLVPDRKDALRRDQVFCTPVPPSTAGGLPSGFSLIDQVEGPPDFRRPGLMNSPWAEIAWFLVPTGEFTSGSQTTPIYALYRRARLLIAPRRDSFYATSPTAPLPPGTPPGGAVPWAGLGAYYGVSVEPDPSNPPPPQGPILLWNSEYSVAEQPYVGRAVARSMMYQPQNAGLPSVLTNLNQWVSAPVRVGEQVNNGFPTVPVPVAPESAALLNDDLITTDVISFEIKVLRPGDADFRDLNDGLFLIGGVGGIPAYTDPITGTPGTYDTATTRPGYLSLRAIKVTIRVWDFKTQQARQISIIQDL